jgi:hypothetical protein
MDVKETLEMVHKRKLDASASMMAILHDLRDNYPAELSIQHIVKWSATEGNTSILTPILLIQLKFRKFIIGERYWQEQTKKRAEDPEKCRIEYIREFQRIVKGKLTTFANRKAQEKLEAKVNAKKRLGKAEQNIARKQSLLLDAFKLRSSGIVSGTGSPNRVTPTNTSGEGGDSPSSPDKSFAAEEKKLFSESSKKKLKPSTSSKSMSGGGGGNSGEDNRPMSSSSPSKKHSMKSNSGGSEGQLQRKKSSKKP